MIFMKPSFPWGSSAAGGPIRARLEFAVCMPGSSGLKRILIFLGTAERNMLRPEAAIRELTFESHPVKTPRAIPTLLAALLASAVALHGQQPTPAPLSL